MERVDGTMKIYKITINDVVDWDSHDGHVIVAISEERVRMLAAGVAYDEGSLIWLDNTRSTVEVVGIPEVKDERIVLSSFRAG